MAHHNNNPTRAASWIATFKELAVLLLVVFLVRTFGFGLYQVPTGSMETTMLVGERFFADKFTILFAKPKRLEIISFNDPQYAYSSNRLKRLFQEYVWGPSNWTKRVIGVPGDTVRGVIEDGKPVVYVNDKKLEQPFVNQCPLIALWSNDPSVIKEHAEREALELVSQGALDVAMINAYIDHALLRDIEWRSYDQQYALNAQPYYRMHKDQIVHGTIEDAGVSVTPDGMWLRMPNVPLQSHQDTRPIGAGAQFWNGTDEFYVTLGKGQYWLMGDNRRGSHDCRFFGPVEERLIHGKIIFRIWSIDSAESWWIWDLIKHPIDFWARVRWHRFFQCVR